MTNLPPFEDRAAYGGFFPALFQTWVGACFRPAEFFESVGNNQDLGPALLFGVVVGWVTVVLTTLVGMVFQAPFMPLMGRPEEATRMFAAGVGGLVFAVLLGWLLPLIGIIVGGLVVHLFLMIFGGANRGLTMTLRVVSYANAPQIFAVVPLFGSCISAIWTIALEIIGLATSHRTDTWRAALAVLVPVLLCVCAAAVFYGALFAAMFGAAHRP